MYSWFIRLVVVGVIWGYYLFVIVCDLLVGFFGVVVEVDCYYYICISIFWIVVIVIVNIGFVFILDVIIISRFWIRGVIIVIIVYIGFIIVLDVIVVGRCRWCIIGSRVE